MTTESHQHHHDHHSAVDEKPTPPAHDHHSHEEHQPEGGHGGHGSSGHMGHEILFRNRFWVSLVLTIPVLIYTPMLQHWLGFSPPAFGGSTWIAPLLSTIVFFYGGLPFLQMAGGELRDRQPGMMTLIALAITVAFVFSVATLLFDLGEDFFWELVTLIDIMLLGHWLEMRSVRQASGALGELAKLMPDTAERITADSTETVPLGQLKTGDKVLVRPGSSIPTDGEVYEGSSDVDEAMITGESKPIKKEPGDKVIGGTVNEGGGSLRVQVTAVGQDTALSGIMRLVEQAQASKSKTQLLADQAAGFLFYVALAVAILTGIIWTIAIGFDIEVLKRVVTVLIIACPHALGLAVPLVVTITTSLSARHGILVRSRVALEAARSVNIVIFDKTGTLTKGEQGVVGMVTAANTSEQDALSLASAIEADSEHSIAQAIVQAAEARSAKPTPITDFEALKGRGVQAKQNGTTVYMGGPRLLEHLAIQLPQNIAQFSEQSGAKGQAVIYLIRGQEAIAAFAIADVIREESHEAIRQLHEMGIQVAMLTGDSQAVAEAVANELQIDHYFAEVLPEDKDKKVGELQKEGKKVAMVGDGVNDAPALTRADIGIAIGSGTDVAVESAGLILVQSNPLDVVKIIKLSRASQRKMVQNIWWAAGYNIIAIPLAAGVLAPWGINMSPAAGAIAMSLSTIVVAINAQTLRQLVLD